MAASIEAPLTLLQKPVKVVRFDAVELAHMTLRLAPEILDPVDVIAPVAPVDKHLGMVDPPVTEDRDIQGIVRHQLVRVNDAVRDDLLLDNRHQCLGSGVRDDTDENSPAPLQQPEYDDLARSAATPLALASATVKALVHLHFPGQKRGGLLVGDQPPKTHEKSCGRVPLNTHNLCRRPCCRTGNKQLNRLILLGYS